jgi:hypothetical protein
MAFRKVNEFKEITLVYSSNGVATLQFYTDMPGGALAVRLGAGVTLPTTSSKRQSVTIPLDGIEGTEFYPSVTAGSTTQLRLFSGVVYLRPIGVFLDGSTSPTGEIWQTVPIAPGA